LSAIYLALFMLLFFTAKVAKEYAKVAINSLDFAFFAKKLCVPCGKTFFRFLCCSTSLHHYIQN